MQVLTLFFVQERNSCHWNVNFNWPSEEIFLGWFRNLKGTPGKDEFWPKNIQNVETALFLQVVYHCFINISATKVLSCFEFELLDKGEGEGGSHVGSLFINVNHKKVSSSCIVHLCHTCQPYSKQYRFFLMAAVHGSIFITFRHQVLTH